MKKLVISTVLAAAALSACSTASASPLTGPDTAGCAKATASLKLAVDMNLLYNKDVYPGDKVPTADQVTPAFLALVLADKDLGGGARAEVEATVKAFAERDKACKAPPTTPVTATPTAAAAPPLVFADCAAVVAAGKAPLLITEPGYRPELDSDKDGLACERAETGAFGQIGGVAPIGGVDTGA